MATDPVIAGVLNLPFVEQIDYFKRKLHLPSERWNDLMASAHDRAFVVAGALKADLLADLHASLLKHMDGGGGLEGYRKDFKAIVAKHGWTGWTGEGTPGGVAWRTRVTYMPANPAPSTWPGTAWCCRQIILSGNNTTRPKSRPTGAAAAAWSA